MLDKIVWHTEQRKVNDLIPWEKNPRQMTEKQAKDLRTSLERLNLMSIPVIDTDNTIISGHQRMKTMQLLGRGDEIIDVRVPNRKLTQKELEEANLRENKNLGEWDFDLLANFDTDMLLDVGWIDEELTEIFQIDPPGGSEGNTDPDAVPDPPAEPKAKYGDIYQLGRHRLMCGDSTKREDVEMLMGGEKAEILFASPPYSDMREYRGNKDLSVNNLANFISSFLDFVPYYIVNLGIKREDCEIIEYWQDYISKAKECGIKLLSWNVWDKGECGSIGNQSAMFGIRHEWLFVFGATPKKLNLTNPNNSSGELANYTGNRQKDGTIKKGYDGVVRDFRQLDTVLNLSPQKARNLSFDHPAIFPINLPEEYINAMTNENDIVIEPFCGSGSTLIACEKTNRRCFAMELDPVYIDVIIIRWEGYTGQKAEKIA